MASRLERAAETNAQKIRQEREKQVQLIAQMKDAGYSLARIAAVTGLSRTGVRDKYLRSGKDAE
jgi:lambda repressor-like predicted transcriptional regulator